jgi:tRNA threonylcarbamoyladenosine biosynthesis protein TsaB
MRILGIDTAITTASVALVEGKVLLAEESSPPAPTAGGFSPAGQRSNHAEILLPLVESVLKRAQVTLSELGGLAVSVGPGSFTGLRIGLSTVKGLAYGWDIPVVGISTLLANAARATTWNGLICSLLDARKNEVYAAVFRKDGLELKRLTDDCVADIHSVIQAIGGINPRSCLFLGEGCKYYGRIIAGALGSVAQLNDGAGLPSIATGVAQLGEQSLGRNEAQFVGDLSPVYVRPADAKIPSIDQTQIVDIMQ